MGEMGWSPLWFPLAILGFYVLKWVVRRINPLIYESTLGEKKHYLPPGDLGLPFIGNMRPFLKAFKGSDPDSFTRSLITKYGNTGVYKTHLFGNPSVLVTTPDTCRRVLADDESFGPGWPKSTMELIGKKSFIGISFEEHKRLRRLTAAPVNGHEALSVYIEYIEENVISALEKWSKMGEFEFLTHLRKLTFRIIMYIFLSSESEHIMEAMERVYTDLNYGVRAMAINLPGFAYHKGLKARKKLVAILQSAVDERRNKRMQNITSKRKDMLDNLMDVEDENGRHLDDEEIIDVLLMYLNAGHESSGHTIMWATIFLQENPEYLQKAKEEQERILKKRPAGQKGLTLKETREMEYLSQVVDETLRVITFSLTVFREAKTDVNVNGYLIPKGWKVLTWFRNVHLDPEIYPNPKKFNPDRWDDGFTPKAGAFLPFGGGRHLCPGNDLAKLEVSIFLHHFLLNYRVERSNPKCPVMYLPHNRPKDNCLAIVRKTKW
ncbi:PREDICTED: ent-kaurenoic acid oxidase 1 [Tarenaya hassleriana]|uniref:ent-kaurenoic acid oxidase 1 n=1 Tax=Tarenaya hassleriana TaxID=28532 RepID=UPI00053C53E2|nr:PREDICTED: ent-kaurenoic acid oxidase 1 [Tarenaya hassleriana]XP_010557000.1 PREDICTED: ent-kaurenoic acid oxidase 1 [Tarenaya hassleriana]